MPKVFSVRDVTTIIEKMTGHVISPKTISDGLYMNRLQISAPIFGGRRFIAASDVPAVVGWLKRQGHLPVGVDPLQFATQGAELATF